MVDWQALEGIGGVATALALVIAVAFGVAQIRQTERVRRQTATTQMINNLLAPHVIDAVERILRLPEDAPHSAVDTDTEMRRAFLAYDFAVEGMGVLVHERTTALHAVDRQMGGVARAGWRRVRRYVEEERVRSGNPAMAEWWQWLVERMDEDPAPGKREGAHVAFRDWSQ